MQQNLLPHRNYLTRRRAQTLRDEGNMLNLSEMRNLLEPMPPNDQIGIQQNAERRENSQSRHENTGDRAARGEQQNRGRNREQPNFTERMEYDESIVDDGAVSLVGEADENELLGVSDAHHEQNERDLAGFYHFPRNTNMQQSLVRQKRTVGDENSGRHVNRMPILENLEAFGGHDFEYSFQRHHREQQFRQRPNFEGDSRAYPPPPPWYGSYPWMPPPWFNAEKAPPNQCQNQREATEMQQSASHSTYNRLEAILILDKLPDINGREGSDRIRAFFRKFEIGTEGWTNAEKLKALQLKVTGKAERSLNAAVDFERTASKIGMREVKFDLIKKEMLQTLDELDARETSAFDELFTGLQRRSNESIDQLADRVGRTVQRAYPNLNSRDIDELSIKHFLRALDSHELALTLEVSRSPSMSYDQFVALASRAESTKRAVQKSISRQRQYDNQNVNRSSVSAHFPQSRASVTCFNCGKAGHISTFCTEPRQNNPFSRDARNRDNFNAGMQTNSRTANENRDSWQNRQNFPPRTGGNQQPLMQQTFKRSPNQFGGTNAANCIQIEEIPAENKFTIGTIGTKEDVQNWLEELILLNKEEKGAQKIGKLVVLELFINGAKTSAMLDGGAQLCLISANSLYKLVREGTIHLHKGNYNRTLKTAYDFNGKKINTFGVVTLSVNRDKLEPVEIEFFITSASFGFDLLIGTNALGLLGLKLYDEKTDSIIEFECIPEKEKTAKNEIRVACTTVLAPRSITLVPLEINKDIKNDFVVTPMDELETLFRVEPSIVCTNNRKFSAPVSNYGACAIELLKDEIMGVAEEPEEIIEAENGLSFRVHESIPKICKVQATMCSVERTERLQNFLPNFLGKITKDEQRPICQLICDFEEIFAFEDQELTQTDLVMHHVETGTAPPVKMRVRPVPYAFREKVATMLQDYLDRGLIRPSWSPYASPIVLVPKKDGTIRFCVDYRGLNAITVKDAFPLPNIDNTLMMLGNKKVFSTMDFMSGYWQIKMHPDSVSKSAFTTEFGLYEYLVMPFGMSNAVATFQRFMTRLFDGILNDFVFIYIDDILVASESFEKHLEHLQAVFERIKMASLRLKISKCCFVAEELPFLGHILTREGIKKDSEKIQPILDLPIPKTKKELQSFLGLMTYYRKFIYNFGKIAAPLFRKLKKEVTFALDDDELTAIEILKSKISENVVLHFPDFNAAQNDPDRMFLMMTDASKIGVAAVLCQPDEAHNLRPIYFASRQCNQAESRYAPTELEALAICFGVKKFAQFISMIPTRVLTDHKALIPMFKTNGETGNWRVDKWIMQMRSRFILTVEFRPGKSNIVADVLSRNFPNAENFGLEKSEKMDMANINAVGTTQETPDVSRENLRKWQQKTAESELKSMVEFFKDRILPNDPREIQRVMSFTPFYTLLNGLLYHCDKETGKLRLFVPEEFRNSIVNERHSGLCGGHFSARKLFLQLSEKYFWPNMRGDCNRAAENCRICAHTRQPRANQPGVQMVETSEPLELVCLDILDIGRSRAKNRYILVCVDHFTKWTVAESIPNKSAETVAQIFVENFVLIFGAPRRIHSDRGKEFVNSTLEAISKILKMEVSTTCGYDPQANGLAERTNQTIIRMLKRTTISEWDWDLKLPYVIFALNVTPSAATGFSPYALMFGRVVNFPTDQNVEFDVDPWHSMDEDTYLQAFRENLSEILGEARKNAEISREKDRIEFNSRKNVKIGKFVVGDRVMVAFPSEKQKARIRKLAWNHFGPYKITEISNSSAFVVPIDKLEYEPIKVPLERLIRIPPGVPDISILPGKKNPFKNLMKIMGIFEGVRQNQWAKLQSRNDENLKMEKKLIIYSLGTTNFSGGGDGGQNKNEGVPKTPENLPEKVLRLGDGTFHWLSDCKGIGHELCAQMRVADFDRALDRSSELGAMTVPNPLKALLAVFILRQLNSNTAARQMVNTIIKADSGQEWVVFIGNRGNLLPSTALPTTCEVRTALECQIVNCKVANQALALSNFTNLMLEPPVMPFEGAESEKWLQIFGQAPWILETIRAKFVHRLPMLETPRVIIGDFPAQQLNSEMTDTALVTSVEDGLAGIVRQFASVILSSKVRAVLVVLGRDALLSGETMDTITEYVKRIKGLCLRYQDIQIVWAIPPYVHTQKVAYDQFLEALLTLTENCPIQMAFVTRNGRSLAEIFRYGGTHNGQYVNQTGILTDAGIKAVRIWLYNVANFPGEREMGRRRSVIGNVPSGSHNRLGDGSGRENAENEVPGRSESRPGSSTGRRSFMANHHRRNDAGCNRHDRIPIRDRVLASRRRPEFGNSRSNIAVSTHRHRYLTGQPNRSFM